MGRLLASDAIYTREVITMANMNWTTRRRRFFSLV